MNIDKEIILYKDGMIEHDLIVDPEIVPAYTATVGAFSEKFSTDLEAARYINRQAEEVEL